MPETLPTQVLIDRVQHGDRWALEELSNRYLLRVLAAVRIRLGADLRRKVESWDIVQEVMLEALGKLDSFDFRSEGAFLKYLNRVVENQIRDQADHWRAQRRNANREISLDAPRSPGGEKPLEIEGAAPTPSQIISLREDLSRLTEALDLVAPEYRELIVAVKIEGQTYREVAKERGTTDDAIRMKLKRAEAKLASAYQQLERKP